MLAKIFTYISWATLVPIFGISVAFLSALAAVQMAMLLDGRNSVGVFAMSTAVLAMIFSYFSLVRLILLTAENNAKSIGLLTKIGAYFFILIQTIAIFFSVHFDAPTWNLTIMSLLLIASLIWVVLSIKEARPNAQAAT